MLICLERFCGHRNLRVYLRGLHLARYFHIFEVICTSYAFWLCLHAKQCERRQHSFWISIHFIDIKQFDLFVFHYMSLSTVSLWSWSWLFVRLFGVLRPTREFFTHLETSPLPVRGCKFWPRHIWPLSSDGFLACHTYCDKGHLFISDTNPWYRAFCRGAVITCFNELGLSRLGFKPQTFCLRYRRSKPLRHRRG